MAPSVTGEVYSPLATPTRSSLRQPGGRAGSIHNSVRFFGITHEDADDDHTSGVAVQGHSAIAIKQAIFNKYFNEFTSYPLLLSHVSQQSTRGNSRAGSRASRSGASTPSINNNDHFGSGAAWTPISSASHIPSDFESPGPRWAISTRRSPIVNGKDTAYGTGPLHAATRPVTTDGSLAGSLAGHRSAFETLLSKAWSSKEVQHAQTHGFFRRLVPLLGEERLQGPAALLLARCARLHPPLLLPLVQRLCAALPLLINSPRRDTATAGLCLLGVLWRAAADGPSQLQAEILEAPRLLEALAARVGERSVDALWAVRELAKDARAAAVLERCGALGAVCKLLRGLVAAAAARAADVGNAGKEGDVDERGCDGGGSKDKGAVATGSAGGASPSGLGVAAAGGEVGGAVPRGSKRLGVTEGGELVEQAAEGVLVAECIAAAAAVHSAALLVCDEQKIPSKWPNPERCRAPQRLVALLIRIGDELERERGPPPPACVPEAAAALSDGGGSGSGAGARASVTASSTSSSAAATAKIPGSLSNRATGNNDDDDDGDDSYGSEDWEEDGNESDHANGGGGSGAGSGSGGHVDGGEGRGRDGGPVPANESAEQRSRAAVCKAHRQLLDALLQSLYVLASSGHCQKPQQMVQEALRDAGDTAVERLASALRGPRGPRAAAAAAAVAEEEEEGAQGSLTLTLAACSAASYLLWLLASGEFSNSEGSELNVLRGRMAKEAPLPNERAAADSGDGGGGGRYGSTGFGVVSAVADLLLLRLPGWRDPDLGDCVAAAGTTPPPPAPPVMGAGGGAGGAATTAAPPGGSGSTAGSAPGLGSQHGSSNGGGGGGGSSDSQLNRGSGAKERAGSGAGGATPPYPDAPATAARVAPPPDGCDDAALQRRLAPLRIGSPAGVLLTPRNRTGPGAGGTASPQTRYRRSDSSDDDVAAGGSGGSGGEGVSVRGVGGGGGSVRYVGARGATAGEALGNTADLDLDLDLSNVIDSSVELTGKEQVMRMIAAAGSALMMEHREQEGPPGQEEGSVRGEGVAPEPNGLEAAQTAGGSVGDSDGDELELPDNGGGAAVTAAARVPAGLPPNAGDGSASSGSGPGSGSTPLGAPPSTGARDGVGVATAAAAPVGAARVPPLTAARPSALLLPAEAPPRKPPLVPSVATWLGAVRFVRQCRPAGGAALPPPPTAALVQELQTNCVGLLSAVALSRSGCRAVVDRPGLLPYIATLLELPDPDVGDGSAPDAAAAALRASGQELRLQLLALLTNLSLHAEGAAAIASASAGSGNGQSLPEALHRTAERALRLLSESPTSWRGAGQLLEASFTVFTNLHRARVELGLSPDPATGEQRDSFRLAVEALRAPLPSSAGHANRRRLRAAAARMLDSAISAYEGVGRSLARPHAGASVGGRSAANGSARHAAAAKAAAEDEKAVLSALMGLLAGGATASGGCAAAAAAERAACDGAAALWQLMASGAVHPEDVVLDLEPTLISLLGSSRVAGPDPAAMRLAALGLVSCLARADTVARRLWTSPLLPAVLKTHEVAKRRVADGGGEAWAPVIEAVRGVCQALCRACHSEDRGSVVGPDKRVDRWGLTERLLVQVNCRLEFDYDMEGIVLVPREED